MARRWAAVTAQVLPSLLLQTPLKDPKNGTPQYEPITTLGKLRDYWGGGDGPFLGALNPQALNPTPWDSPQADPSLVEDRHAFYVLNKPCNPKPLNPKDADGPGNLNPTG